MKSEKDVKAEIRKVLDSLGAWYFMPVPTGYGVRGVPDFVACICGQFVGIEAKFGGNKQSQWQKIQGDNIVRAQGIYLVVTDKDVNTLGQYLAKMLDI